MMTSGHTTAGRDQRFRRLLVLGVAVAITERASQRGLSVG
jgi:hypothetical protein